MRLWDRGHVRRCEWGSHKLDMYAPITGAKLEFSNIEYMTLTFSLHTKYIVEN